jgi:hypothetical protein
MRRVIHSCACILLLVAASAFAGCGDDLPYHGGRPVDAAGQQDAAGTRAPDAMEAPDAAPAMLVDRAEFEGLRDHPLRMTLAEWKESPVRANLQLARLELTEYPRAEIAALNRRAAEEAPVIAFPGEGGALSLVFVNRYPRGDQDADRAFLLDLAAAPEVHTVADLVRRFVQANSAERVLAAFAAAHPGIDLDREIARRDVVIDVTAVVPALVHRFAFLFSEEEAYDTCNYLSRFLAYREPFVLVSSDEFLTLLGDAELFTRVADLDPALVDGEPVFIERWVPGVEGPRSGDIVNLVDLRALSVDHSATYLPLNGDYVFETSTSQITEFDLGIREAFDGIFEYPEDYEDPDDLARNVQVYRPTGYNGAYDDRAAVIDAYLVELHRALVQ